MVMLRKLARYLRREDFLHHPFRALRGLSRRIYWRLYWRLCPQRPFIFPLSDKLTIRLGPTSNSLGIFLHRGFSDAGAIQLFIDYLEPGMVMFDCGAHIGEYTIVAASLVGSTGQVHSFEPDPRNYRYLEENVRRHGFAHVTLNPVALGEHRGEARFRLGADPTTSSAVLENETVEMCTVPVVSLDDYAAKGAFTRVDAIKIDIEGAELAAVKGATKLIERFRPALIFIECDQHENAEPLTALLRAAGYDVHQPVRGGLHPHLVARHSA